MKKVIGRLRYANVTATLALIVALGGTSYAAIALPLNSVGTPQLKANAVTKGKIANSAVSNGKLAANSIGTGKVIDGSLLSKDFAAGQLPAGATGPAGPAGAAGAAGAPGTARAYAHVNMDGSLDVANSKGVNGSVLGTSPGRYCFALSFVPQNIIASAERPSGGTNGMIAQPAVTSTINVVCPAGFQEAGVFMFDSTGTLANNPFWVMFN